MSRLCWEPMRLLDMNLPAGMVKRAERRRMVMPRRYQFDWLQRMCEGRGIWLETGQGKAAGGSQAFARRVACMLYQRGMLANLSLRENILLPFLYAGHEADLVQATEALPEIAGMMEIDDILDEQAGERSGYVHGLVALARAMLQSPDFIIVQDVHAGMQPQYQKSFRSRFASVVQQLSVGVLYLSNSAQDGSGLDYCQSLEFVGTEEHL